MFGRLFKPTTVAYAHCDIPCGIYDPTGAKIAADTVAKMVEKIGQLPKDSMDFTTRNNFVRMVGVKEAHAEICKKELQVLWSDYFKPEHLEKFPKLHDSFWKALKLASKNKQNVDAAAAGELQAAVKEISDMFWASKK
ncbi:MAG TPA: superoxide dismutase, Ni [Candidatus Limnocylindrales bacterium]|nr:superoxide dismutase, Ni [Candidatus Limnocylindrales bacterium]